MRASGTSNLRDRCRIPPSSGQFARRQRDKVLLTAWPLNDPRLEAVVELHSMPAAGSTKPSGGHAKKAIDAAERAPDIDRPSVGVFDQRALGITSVQSAWDEHKTVSWYVDHGLAHQVFGLPINAPANLVINSRRNGKPTYRLKVMLRRNDIVCRMTRTECYPGAGKLTAELRGPSSSSWTKATTTSRGIRGRSEQLMSNPVHVFKLLKLIAAGLFATAIGIWLLIDPDMGLPAGERRLNDYMPGFCALVVGLVILAFVVWVAVRSSNGK